MERPSVNWEVLENAGQLFKWKELRGCNQHILHDALQTAAQTSISNLDKVIKAMYWLLHESPFRRKTHDYKGV